MSLPTGTTTFLFTDLSDTRHLRSKAIKHHGRQISTSDDVSVFAFARVSDAIAVALDAERTVAPARPRMAIHTVQRMSGERPDAGTDVQRAACICHAAHAGQILVSDSTRIVLEQALPENVTLKPLGEHRLKDLLRPERLFQVLHPDLVETFPPPRTLDVHPNNLRPQPTALIGREAELRRAYTALHEEGVRLLTLTGPGGIGKTRLALHLAAEVIGHFRHGAFFVPLAHVSDPDLIVPSIAQVLGVNEMPARALLCSLQEYLEGRVILLVLDNLEQVIEAASTIDGLLGACPDLTIIATSRERLRLNREREFPVSVLEIPAPWNGAVDGLAWNPAAALFVDRCRFVQPEFALTPDIAGAVAAICIRLEGLPLAIELAAARIKILTPHEIARRLDDRFRLLRRGPGDAPQRHQSLQAAISWSYDLLTAVEQRLFRRLAAFRGGFALESAEAVCGDDDADILDGLSSLVDKSLLRRVPAPVTPRFVMLETIREYAIEQLTDKGELDDTRRLHAEHFAALAEQTEDALGSRDEEDKMGRLWQDLENVRSAVDWSLQDSPQTAARLGTGLGALFYHHGHLTEGRARLEEILRATGQVDEHLRARVLFQVGVLAWSLNDWDQARVFLEQSLALFRRQRDGHRQAMATAFVGHVARSNGKLEEASQHYQTALGLYRQIGSEWGIAWELFDLGRVARDRGHDDEAMALHEQSLALFRKKELRWGIAWQLWSLGVLAHRHGDDARARALFAESAALYRDMDDRRGIAQCLESLASVVFVSERLPEAVRILSAADALRTGMGAPLALSDRRDYDRTLEGVKAAMAAEEFEREWNSARTLAPDDAIHLALEASQHGVTRVRLPGQSRGPLTPREREVAVLIARGLSNREIATKLTVAERTAISHIEHIMNKLALHSRAQIAVWAVRHGLDLPVGS